MNTLNFNRYRPPILPIEMLDDERTVINVVPPTVDLQEELRACSTDLYALLNGGNDEQRTALWDLAARLISCNRNMRKVTPEQLQKDFRLDEEDLVVFYEAYVAFVTGIENAKN
jgi:hypothetical protein